MSESLARVDVAPGYRPLCPCRGGVLELIWSRRFRITVLRDGPQVELSAPR